MLSAALLPLLGTLTPSQAPDIAGAIPPHARPVAVWLTAVKDGDQDQLKTVFSERMRRQFDSEGWDNVMRTYQEVFNRAFGTYRPEDFSFQFKGDDNRGIVSIAYKGRTLSGLQVIKRRRTRGRSTSGKCTPGPSLPADDVAVVDGLADQRSGAGRRRLRRASSIRRAR